MDAQAPGRAEIMARERRVDRERLADLPRTRQKAPPLLDAAAGLDRRQPGERLAGADKDRGRLPLRAAHEVEEVVDPVAQVHVRAPWRPEHRGVALGTAGARVVGAVPRPAVGLDLDDPQAHAGAAQLLAEEVARDLEGVAGEEAPGQARPVAGVAG
jgi:hypothetical protein